MNRRVFTQRLVGAFVASQLPVLPSAAQAVRYRGAHSAPLITPENILPLPEAGANILRYSINAEVPEVKHYPWLHAVQYSGDYLAAAVRNVTQASGVSILLSLHSTPKNKIGRVKDLNRAWNRLALQFKDDSAVSHYGLLNEPRMGSATCARLMTELYKSVRRVDKSKTILMQVPRAEAPEFNRAPIIRGLRNVAYELHHYWPFNFTHQGIYSEPGVKYPTRAWNKKSMRAYMAPVRRFQLKSGRAIFVAEFGASVFADEQSRKAWFEDSISLFEEWGWSWCYHAWRENPAWNAEAHPEVFEVLKNGWRRNK